MTNERENTAGKRTVVQDDKLQNLLHKVIAEQNQEKYLEYHVETDTAYFFAVVNGRTVLQEIITEYLAIEENTCGRVTEEDRALFCKELNICLKKPSSRIFDVRYLNREGEKIWYRMVMVSMSDERRKVNKIGAKIVCIHKEKTAAELLRKQAQQDSLTGMYNHKNYEDLCRNTMRKNSDGILFLMVDIDDFKLINDSHGHHAGDSVIKQLGEVLNRSVKNMGIAGRTGGDEFSICMTNVWEKETALDICIRIKDALKNSVEGVDFTISIGATRSNGRLCEFEKYYFEADEALYFVKEHGKNQIVFYEDLEQKKEEAVQELMTEEVHLEDEIALDDLMQCHLVVDPATGKILYINKPARKKLGLTLEEAKKIPCYELLLGKTQTCTPCDLYCTRVDCLKGATAEGLKKYAPQGQFLLQSHYTKWQGKPARQVSFMDLADGESMEKAFKHETERQQAISKCYGIISGNSTLNLDYTELLKVLAEYYEAECCAIIAKEDGQYRHVYEYHKSHANAVASGLYHGVKDGVFDSMEVLLDKNGMMRKAYIDKQLKLNPHLVPELEKGFVHNTVGIKLARQDDFAGILMVINPRKHEEDVIILRILDMFFTSDIIRKLIVDKKSYEETHDKLTGLWNRAFFGVWQSKFAYMYEKQFAAFTADVFHLKAINRDFGYENGNERLIRLAELFKSVFAGYSVFRYDTDQMLAVCDHIEKEDFQKLVRYFNEQIRELGIEVSVGYSWRANGDLGDAIREANDYLLKDKMALEKNNEAEEQTYKYVEKDIHVELEKGNFRVFLQPKVRISTGKTVGAEALIRLYDEVRGFVSPAFFIPLLEERGVIHMIDLFVIEEVFKFQKEALDLGREVVPISVNFSKNTLMHGDMIEQVRGLCKKYRIPDGLIQIEITETISSMEHVTVNSIATSLRSMGFSVAMDDFGTKYSNMAVLTQFEFDTVKLDRSLMLDVERNKKNETILRHTLAMLDDLHIDTVMEGIETKEQIEILKTFGCDTVQGYFYGRPEPKERFYELFMKNNE